MGGGDMTPKEKAEELVQSMYNVDVFEDYNTPRMQYTYAIRCALIAVDEIIKAIKDENLYIQGETNISEIIDYWKEVKTEIEKI